MNQEKGISLFLLRHGNTFESHETPRQVGARTDLPLTQYGQAQAAFFANYLKINNIIPSTIYAGSLKRQTETAQIVGKTLNVENKIATGIAALNEIDYGLWEGLTTEEICRHWKEEHQLWDACGIWQNHFKGTQEGHIKNIGEWLKNLSNAYAAGDTVVAVTSNGILRFFNQLVKNGVGQSKVKTGHFCELILLKSSLHIVSWNQDPSKENKYEILH